MLFINTIGLTGAEVLSSHLAKHKDILFLPGQNFISEKHNLYRKHYFEKLDLSLIFDELNKDQLRKDGSIWAGPLKNTSSNFLQLYKRKYHKKLFLDLAQFNDDYHELIFKYIKSLFLSFGVTATDKQLFAYWGANYCIADMQLRDGGESPRVINVTNTIDVWLAHINRTMTWDNSKAIIFYLVNNLFIAYKQKQGYKILNVDLNDIYFNLHEVLGKCTKFLDLDNEFNNETPLRGTFLEISSAVYSNTLELANSINQIYKGYYFYEAALTLDEWKDEFLHSEINQSLLDQYQTYWNTTSHTNFDCIGPIETQLMDELQKFLPIKCSYNLNFTFYHQYISLNSDTYKHPLVTHRHYLGCLEANIEIPHCSYYIRAVLSYLEQVVITSLEQRHSYLSLTNSHLFSRLNDVTLSKLVDQCGLTERLSSISEGIASLDLE